jgi:predicted acylesterase/phospholipase RssA/CRP-like cAMP-binding protein
MTAFPYLNKSAVLQQIPIFEGLNWFELNRVARKAMLVEFSKGDTICKQGSPADGFYVLTSGRIQAYTLNASGQKEDVELILRGMHFGVISALTGENHAHSYEAISDCVVLKINKDDFNALLKSTPRLAVTLSQNLSQRIRKHVTRTKETRESTIIAVYAPLKGSGSSTYAANLAIHLRQESGKKVLLLSLSSDHRDQRIDLSDIVHDHHKILKTIIKEKLSVDVLSVKVDKANPAVLNKISQFLSAPVNDYNYIILDLPNEMDDVVMKTLLQSDIIHLVTVDRVNDLEMTRIVIDRLIDAFKDKFHADNIQVIISGIEKKEPMTGEEIKKILNYDVFMVLPYLERTDFSATKIDPGYTVMEVAKGTEYVSILRRLARRISEVMVGVVLGGGAALGMAHIGVIRVLEREEIPVDIIVGSSMGALIGSFWSVGHNAREMEKFGQEFQQKSGVLKLVDPPVGRVVFFACLTLVLFLFHFFILGMMIMFLIMPIALIPISGLVRGDAIGNWLREKLGQKTFHDSKIPLKVVAYDLMQRKEIIIDRGPLVDSVRKSIAIPGVIKPVMEGEQMIIDGGVLNPLPTNVLVDMGVKKIIAINVLQSPQDVLYNFEAESKQHLALSSLRFSKNPVQYVQFWLLTRFSKAFTPNVADIIVRTLQASEYILAEASAKQADIVIHPDLRGINWFELYQVDELIKRGEAAAMKALPAIKELVKR